MSVDTYPAPEVNDTEQLGDAAHFYKDAYIHQLNVMTSGSLDVIKSNNDVHGKWTNTHYVSYHDMQIVKSVSLDSDYPGTPLNAVFTLVGGEGKDAVINLTADDDDDNSDSWQIKSPASNNKFTVGVWTGSAYTARFTITPAGAATFNNAFVFPTADGTADQVLKTDGAGNVAWGTFASNGAGNVVDDTTPQLGGNLDTQGNEITTTAGNDLKLSVGSSADEVHILKANDDIHTKWTNTHCIMFNHLEISKSSYHADYPGSPHDAVLSLIAGEGKNAEINLTADDDDDNSDSWQLKSPASDNEFKIGVWTGARYTERFAVTPAGAATFNNAFVFPTADGTADQVLKTDGSGTVAWGDAASNGAGNVVDDATPQLGGNLDTQGNEITTTAGNDLKLSVGDSSDDVHILKANNDIHTKWNNTHCVVFNDLGIVKSVAHDAEYPGSPSDAVISLIAGEGKDAEINLLADDADNNSDSWQLKSPASDNEFKIGVWTGARYTERFAVTPAGAATFNNAFKFPTADGAANQVLKTNGSGTVAWGDAASNGAGNVVDDATPQLGGNLDTQGNEITTTAGNDLKLSVGSSADEVHILKANDDIHTKWTNTHCIMFNHLEISKSSYHADYPGSPHDAVLSLIAGEGKKC